jgi:Rrf2 family protein
MLCPVFLLSDGDETLAIAHPMGFAIRFVLRIPKYLDTQYTHMLALTTKSKYGIAAVMELAAGHDSGLMQIKAVAGHQNIPRNYLVQVMNGLIKAGIVRTVRGKHGGYTLSKSPEKITLFEVLEALEGPLELKTSGPKLLVIKNILQRAEDNLRQSLSVSISELIVLHKDLENDWTFQI